MISCPGADLTKMATDDIKNYLIDRGVSRLAILGGTNDLVSRNVPHGESTPVTSIKPRLESTIDQYKAGLKVAVSKVPSRKGYESKIIQMNKMYRTVCRERKVLSIEQEVPFCREQRRWTPPRPKIRPDHVERPL